MCRVNSAVSLHAPIHKGLQHWWWGWSPYQRWLKVFYAPLGEPCEILILRSVWVVGLGEGIERASTCVKEITLGHVLEQYSEERIMSANSRKACRVGARCLVDVRIPTLQPIHMALGWWLSVLICDITVCHHKSTCCACCYLDTVTSECNSTKEVDAGNGSACMKTHRGRCCDG